MHTTATTQNDFLKQAFPLAQASSYFLTVTISFQSKHYQLK